MGKTGIKPRGKKTRRSTARSRRGVDLGKAYRIASIIEREKREEGGEVVGASAKPRRVTVPNHYTTIPKQAAVQDGAEHTSAEARGMADGRAAENAQKAVVASRGRNKKPNQEVQH